MSLPAITNGQELSSSLSHVNFEHIELPNNTINSVIQDSYGFIWIGTFDGLFKYDGYSITEFRHDSKDSTSVSASWIEKLYVDKSGALWIGTAGGGLNKFLYDTSTFGRYVHDAQDPQSLSHNHVRSILEDSHGHFWVGTRDGLNLFDRKTKTFKRFKHDETRNTSLSFNDATVLLEDSHGVLWIGTGGDGAPKHVSGLNRFDRNTEEFIRYDYDPADSIGLKDNRVWAMLEVNNDQLLVGSCRGGLYIYSREQDEFKQINMDHLSSFRSLTDINSAPCIKSMFQEPAGSKSIWIGSAEGGLTRFESDFSQFNHFAHSASNSNSIRHNRVWELAGDRTGTLWVGTLEGLSKVDLSTGQFRAYRHYPGITKSLSHEQAYAIFEDKNEELWVGTPNGLNKLERDKEGFERIVIKSDKKEQNAFYVKSIFEDQKGNFWVGSSEGFGLFDRDSKDYRILYSDLDVIGHAINHTDWLVLESEAGFLWVGTSNGLYQISPIEGILAHFKHNPDDENSISGNSIRSMYKDQDGNLWAGTYGNGLNKFESDQRGFSRYLPGMLVTDIAQDQAGRFWIGTFTQGLLLFDPITATYKAFTTKDGLASNEVAAVQEDGKGYLWVSTGNGISKFDPAVQEFKNFTSRLGQQEGRYNWGSAFKSKDGEIYFGGGKGVTRFMPSEMVNNPYPPQVALTNFKIFNKAVSIGPDSPLKVDITVAKEILLPHFKNDFSFEFAALHYKRPEENQYAYRLEGYDDDWQYINERRVASFTNLDFGKYVFRVKAANNDGVWSDYNSLTVTIQPPWWLTWWAYIVYGVLIVGIIGITDRIQRNRLVARERLRAEREKAKAIETTNNDLQRALRHLTETQDQLIHTEKMASLGQLTAGIAHEIKNPLNFVNNFASVSSEMLEELKEWIEEKGGLNEPEVRELVETLEMNASLINEHGKRADNIIRSMLEHSRAGKGEKRLVVINKLVDEYVNLSYHGVRAREKDFEVKIARDFHDSIKEIEVSPQEIGRVLINILDNAFYSVHEKANLLVEGYDPEVSIITAINGEFVEVRIEDNGVGISEDLQEKIFEPFFTTKPAGSGTGLGLSLSHEIIVQGHGGELKVESSFNNGAKFIISLPKNES